MGNGSDRHRLNPYTPLEVENGRSVSTSTS